MSKKQELIQLHQLFANISYRLEKTDYATVDRDNFSRYNDIPITSLDINKSAEKQKEAVFALVKDLNEELNKTIKLEQADLVNWVEQPAQQSNAHTVENGEIERTTVVHDPSPPAATTDSYTDTYSQPVDPDVRYVTVKDSVGKTQERGKQETEQPTQTVETLELFFDDFEAEEATESRYENVSETETESTTDNLVQATITP